MPSVDTLKNEFARELEHWSYATERLANLDAIASPHAWRALEHYVGVSLRQALTSVLARVRQMVQDFDTQLRTTSADPRVDELQTRLVNLRRAYLRAETAVDFYQDVLASREVPHISAMLRACDHIATRAMAEILTPLGRE